MKKVASIHRSPALVAIALGILGLCLCGTSRSNPQITPPPKFSTLRGDWPQLGGSPHRNNAPRAESIPTEWDVASEKNIKWRAKLGSQTHGNIVVANKQVYVGTNNAAGYLKRFSSHTDLNVLLCFRESDGEFLWQHSTPRHSQRRQHDCWMQGNHSSPVVEGNRLWFVTARGEVVCLDTEGFRDNENDGVFQSERPDDPTVAWEYQLEADIVWKLDMPEELGVRPQYRATCSPTIWGDVLFVCTSNGASEDHLTVPAPEAPSFLALDKHTGKVLWKDNSPGKNILHSQSSSPAVGILDNVPQVLFGGGDGWLYSFRADRWSNGKPELLWKFDGNPKDSVYQRGSRGTRNSIAACPVIHAGRVYLSMGADPDHGEGDGHLWCIDPTRRGDVSPELVVDQDRNVIPHQRRHALASIGNLKPSAIPNPNSAAVWHYDAFDQNRNGKTEFEETMHRTVGSPVIKNDLLIIGDYSGLVHCLNARTGKPHWTCDLVASCLASALIVEDKVYIADEDGKVSILSLSSDPTGFIKQGDPGSGIVRQPAHEINMASSISTMPIVANNVLFIASRNELFAIAAAKTTP